MRILTIAALSTAAVLAIAAPANAQAVMTDASFADLRAIAESLDSVFMSQSEADADQPYIQMKSSDGLKYVLYGLECTGAGAAQRCSGIDMSLTFNLKSSGAAADAESIVDYAALTDYIDGKDLNLTRYMILDGGVTRANISENMRVFTSLSNKAWEKLTDEGLFPSAEN